MMTRATNQIQTAMGRVNAASDQQRPFANQLQGLSGCQIIKQTPATSNSVNNVSVRKSEQRRIELGSMATSNPANKEAMGRSHRAANTAVKTQTNAPRKHWAVKNNPRRSPPSQIRPARKSGYTGVRATFGSSWVLGAVAMNPLASAMFSARER